MVKKKSNRTLWAAYVKTPMKVRSDHSSLLPNNLSTPTENPLRILGVDPSLRGTGLAIIEYKAHQEYRLVKSKKIALPQKYNFSSCLREIYNNVMEFIEGMNVEVSAMEKTIYVQNFQIAQILGAARGSAIAAIANNGLDIIEYAPLRIKQAVVGYGRASKKQVVEMMKKLLMYDREDFSSDEADAAAVALCHALNFKNKIQIKNALSN